MVKFDQRDAELLGARIAKRSAMTVPMVGDFVEMADGTLHRFTHDWGDDLQTAPAGHGSFYLERGGSASYSGGLDPAIPKKKLQLTEKVMDGSFWFFHHDSSGAHRGVQCMAPCRVYRVIPA